MDLRYYMSGRMPEGRGGSSGNTTAALGYVVRLVHGVDDEMARDARHRIDRWIEAVRQGRDIGESKERRPTRRSTGSSGWPR
ncbi:hypothetical protein [Nonomuraea sp. NPDC048901]|uniref:hypothetical protein n=1 Tax=Nonomuraea sp. NPDC048901 TaxID=3155627 RepID=UPI0033CAFC47